MGRHLSIAAMAVGEVDKEQRGQVAFKSTYPSIKKKRNFVRRCDRLSRQLRNSEEKRAVDAKQKIRWCMVLAARAFIQRIDRLLVTAYMQGHNGCIGDYVLGSALSLYKKAGSMALAPAATGSLPRSHSKHIFPAAHQLPCTAIHLVAIAEGRN